MPKALPFSFDSDMKQDLLSPYVRIKALAISACVLEGFRSVFVECVHVKGCPLALFV
jgi:hypothetical protein